MNEKFYSEYYRAMDKHFLKWRELTGIIKAENIINIAEGKKIENVLEIGCGTGIIIKTLSERGFADRYYAVDISHSAVEYVKNQNIKNLEEVKRSDALKIEYKNKNFDLAILFHILEHLEEPEKALLEAKRIAKYIVLEVPLEDNFLSRLKSFGLKLVKFDKNYVPKNDVGHVIFFNKKKAVDLITSSGLFIEKSRILHLSRKTLFFNSKSFQSRMKMSILFIFQILARITHLPLVRTHFVILATAKNDQNG